MPIDVSAPFPDLNLKDESILEVDTGDAGTLITSLVVHVSQDTPEELLDLPQFKYVQGMPGVSS